METLLQLLICLFLSLYFTYKGTTSKELYRKIMNILRKNNLEVGKIIGQSNDGVRNINGSE